MTRLTTLILIAIAGLAGQLVDGGLGMGFGVTSTSILVALAGLGPASASAVVHTAELGTTFVSGLSHWRFGNVNWKVVATISIPGAIGAFAGATVLSNLSTEAAKPIMSLILALIGLNLLLRFSRGLTKRVVNPKPHSTGFLGGLGLFGGFIDATGGGGWGPVTTSTLMAAGRSEPRYIVGTVNTAEFFVTFAATAGFLIGMWEDLVANLASVGALLVGGVIAAPLAAWLVTRLNPVLLGGVVGTLILVLNLPTVLKAVGFTDHLWVVRVAVLVLGLALSAHGVIKSRHNSRAAAEKERIAEDARALGGVENHAESR
ncbi:sulfite exporter TauE/SafE family protein [Corynebacterium liangguodongii]|uniref:Probable membrane transporter protein n=1 Tax=Corynebacterium liangguodongii TaxID=2079535 RepID=A0A2S0WG33_9CORY|nr:sulfite exporter TauE/SafE family protein [Corynebacterium liangguodongii]AWB84735.1 sulfite exporter TauE/SafE family protein [Corynebacterium liangguodongii]PWB99743.1 sulfite exporter TauE/SafE family protein [Corynebacterium liangguodongii]